MMSTSERLSHRAGLFRRLGAMLYDGILLIGVVTVAGLPLPFFESAASQSLPIRLLIQAYLVLVCFLFFGWFWTHGGQTLGMKAWRLYVERPDGSALRWNDAAFRFGAAWLSLLPLGLGFFWLLFDDNQRAWHDRLSGTRMVYRPHKSC